MATAVHSDEASLVSAARRGDDAAFRRLTDPHVHELRVHCYRMLGSLHDAEDLLQETLLRAWQRLDSFEGRAPLRAWLYRIATNACLNARRARQLPPQLHGPATDASSPHIPYAAEILHLEPFPDTLVDEHRSPDESYVAREGIELAFITAIQLLPARQRAVLILREVLGWTATEVAELLETTVPAVNSALQRARRTLARQAPEEPGAVNVEPRHGEAALLERYMHAWEDADMTALAALLKEDAVLAMPPAPSWYSGRDAIIEFFATSRFVFGDEPRRMRLVPTRANNQPAFAAYVANRDTEPFEAYGIMVLRIEEGSIAEITGFGDSSLLAFFGLPGTLAA